MMYLKTGNQKQKNSIRDETKAVFHKRAAPAAAVGNKSR